MLPKICLSQFLRQKADALKQETFALYHAARDPRTPLAAKILAGIVVASIVKEATPRLRVVNHGGNEGLPMLAAYERRLAGLRSRAAASAVTGDWLSATGCSLPMRSVLTRLVWSRSKRQKAFRGSAGMVSPQV